MKPLIPKQHGAWAMLIIPFWLGVIAGQFKMGHALMFIGWLFLYLGSYAILLGIKGKRKEYYFKWGFTYLAVAFISLILPIIKVPALLVFGVLFIPFFFVSAYFSKKNKDRSIWNDLSAIAVFSLAGPAGYYYGAGLVDSVALTIFFTTYLFFMGSTLYVKTMIREKKNITYKYLSWSFHALMLIVWLLLGEWWILLAFIPSFIRAITMYGKSVTIKQVGILEIINSVLFFLCMIPAIL